jgi:hypothetical protein
MRTRITHALDRILDRSISSLTIVQQRKITQSNHKSYKPTSNLIIDTTHQPPRHLIPSTKYQKQTIILTQYLIITFISIPSLFLPSQHTLHTPPDTPILREILSNHPLARQRSTDLLANTANCTVLCESTTDRTLSVKD